jgi:YD repeat-containing protein
MQYDKENRLTLHQQGSTLTTFTYSGNGLKRSETDSTGTTTMVWDGDEYLQGRG